MLRLESREKPSQAMLWCSPVLAVVITLLIVALLLAIMSKDVGRGLQVFLLEPFNGTRALTELALKATPLILCSLGLSLCFRANIFNIGAEGQFLWGAITAGGLALWFTNHQVEVSPWLFMLLGIAAGVLGGMFWASIVALLKDRFNANEILVSLMLVYVADLFLSYLVSGPWMDPHGYNSAKTAMFADATLLPRVVAGMRLHWGFVLALLLALAMWFFMFRTFKGYQLQVGGLAPDAARYAGFSARFGLWCTLLVSGALAGVAGAFEVLGPTGQLTQHVSVKYGFTAIIVAFVARLHPAGCVLASFLLSVLLIGGQLAQTRIGVPASFSLLFQGLLLLVLLACDTFISYRLRWSGRNKGKNTAPQAASFREVSHD